MAKIKCAASSRAGKTSGKPPVTPAATAGHSERPRDFAAALKSGDIKSAVGLLHRLKEELRPNLSVRSERYGAFASVLDACLVVADQPTRVRTALIEVLAPKSGRASRDLVSLLVRAILPYPLNEPLAAHLKRVDRDVRALRYVLAKGLRPHEIAFAAAQPGEGLETWARSYAKDKAATRPGSPGVGTWADVGRSGAQSAASLKSQPTIQMKWKNAAGETLRIDILPIVLDDDQEPERQSVSEVMAFLRRTESYARRKKAIARASRGAPSDD